MNNDLNSDPISNSYPKEDSFPEEQEYEPKKKKKKFRGSLFSYLALSLIASFIGAYLGLYVKTSNLFDKRLEDATSNEYISEPVIINPNEDYNIVSAVVKKTMPSVVGITTLQTQQFLWEQKDVEGLGSGLIVDRNGYILTNSHVIAHGSAKEIKVLFENGEKVEATVLWNDPILDLAIVKVDITNLPAASLGDSDNIQVGETAIAIGNPLGLEFQRTVTSGIISGLNRSIQVDQDTVIDNLIQTDASINRGNSGGPLLNSRGEVIGINTAKISSGEGLGFSIPINTAKSIIEEVINKGSYKTVELGITGLDILEFQARIGIDYGYEKGAIVLQILEGSPAEKYGLEINDIIVAIDDHEVNTLQDLKKALYKYREEDQAILQIIRNREEIKLEITF